MMNTTTASALQAATAAFKRSGQGTGATIYTFTSLADVFSWVGKPCYDPEGNIHILFSVDMDGKAECPKGHKVKALDLRGVNAS